MLVNLSDSLMCWYRTKADKCYWCNLDDIFLPITTPHLIVSNKIYLPNVSQGSVSSKRLHWQKIHDLGSAAWNLLLLVFFNVRAFVFTCIVGLGLQDQSHPGVAFKTWKWERNLSFSGSLYVVKEFGLVFAVHQTFLLDHQFCMVESKNPILEPFVFRSCISWQISIMLMIFPQPPAPWT